MLDLDEDEVQYLLDIIKRECQLLLDKHDVEDDPELHMQAALMEKLLTERDKITSDDTWIMAHAAKLKAELSQLAKEGKPQPAENTLLGRAFKLFTTEH